MLQIDKNIILFESDKIKGKPINNMTSFKVSSYDIEMAAWIAVSTKEGRLIVLKNRFGKL